MQLQWGQGYSDYQRGAQCTVWRAGVGPDWSPAPGVETRNTMDRCPCLGSSIDLIIAWMFIFCRPQHQQLAGRPHTEYFKSSHWNQTLRFIFRCFYSAMILTVGREWWSRHRRITGIRLMLQFWRRPGPGSFITTTVIALYCLVSAIVRCHTSSRPIVFTTDTHYPDINNKKPNFICHANHVTKI